MKNIFILPSTNKSILGVDSDKNLHFVNNYIDDYVNIYIVSDEKIEKGDYGLGFAHGIKGSGRGYYVFHQDGTNLGKVNALCGDAKKIVLTTDINLIDNGIQSVNNEFLEWFVYNQNHEEVKVFHHDVYSMCKWDRRYKIIIPVDKAKPNYDELYKEVDKILSKETKESRTKWLTKKIMDCNKVSQSDKNFKTIEEAAEEWVFDKNSLKWSNNDNSAGDNYGSFIAGANWQSGKMYSEEDVFDIIDKAFHMYASSFRQDAKEWFKEFKNK